MTPIKEDTIIMLRDIVLIEADFLNDQAERMESWAAEGVAPSIIRKRLAVCVTAFRHRVKILNRALEDSDQRKAVSL
jgi:hypothetical protein